MKLKFPKYPFEKHLDIRFLWSFIGIFALGFIITILFSPLNWWLKFAILCFVGLFSLIMVLLIHELFIILKEMKGGKK